MLYPKNMPFPKGRENVSRSTLGTPCWFLLASGQSYRLSVSWKGVFGAHFRCRQRLGRLLRGGTNPLPRHVPSNMSEAADHLQP